MIQRLSEAKTVLAVGNRFIEPSQFTDSPVQEKACRQGWIPGEAEPFPTQIALKQFEDLP